MKGEFESVKAQTIEFAARFGFVTNELYFKYLSPVARTQKYKYWARLANEGFLTRARSSKEVFFLTPKARTSIDIIAVPARDIYLIPHDLIVAQFLLEIKSTLLIAEYWTEYDLKSNAGEARHVLGCSQLLKFPDLVLEMNGKEGPLKIAVEIERSQKTKSRYRQLAYSYLQAKGLDFLIFGCAYQSIEQIVLSAFSGEIFSRASKSPATFLIPDLDKSGLEMTAKFCEHKMSMRKMLLAALKLKENDRDLNRDNLGIAVPRLSRFKENNHEEIAGENIEIAPTTCLPLALRAS